MAQIIDLGQYVGKAEKALVGRDNGEAVKERIIKSGINFEDLEKQTGKITIKIPPEVVTVNKSFFLGLLELSIQRLGSVSAFFEKYEIDASEHIQRLAQDHAAAAMLKASQKDILNG